MKVLGKIQVRCDCCGLVEPLIYPLLGWTILHVDSTSEFARGRMTMHFCPKCHIAADSQPDLHEPGFVDDVF